MVSYNPCIGENNLASLQRAKQSNHHALLVIGEHSAVLGQEIIRQIADKSSVHIPVKPDGNSITIEQIRTLKHSLSLKQVGKQTRYVSVSPAEKMTLDAQNSFLKLLEEPPKGVMFILFADLQSVLLPTIRSRALTLKLSPISFEEAGHHYSNTPKEEIRKAHIISDGKPGKLFELLTDESGQYSEAITLAKQLVSSPVHDRLLRIDELSKDKPGAIRTLEACDDVIRALSSSPNTTAAQLKQFAKSRRMLLKANHDLHKNTNAKLVLLDTFLTM